MKKLIIFDCDGVLVNSEIIEHRVAAKALANLGFPITVEENIRLFTGVDNTAAKQIIIEKTGIIPPDDFFSSIQAAIYKAFETELIPVILPVLQFIAAQNIAYCVASNSNNERVVKSLALSKQLEFFNKENIFTAEQVAKGKPAPDLFLFAALQMGFAAKDCLVIEDSITGIQAALAAKMAVIGFLGGEHTHYDWYQQHINAYNIPIAYNTKELLTILINQIGVQTRTCSPIHDR